jgi:Flp pilus assembly protein TadG
MIAMRTAMAMLMAARKEHTRSQKGTALIEFALILPVFLTLVIGMMYYAMAMYDKTILTMAVQTGARAGAIASADHVTAAQTAGNLACSGNLISFGALPASPVTAAISGGNITVTASFDYQTFYIFPSVNISATTIMRLESP